jgi:hypothetical protein
MLALAEGKLDDADELALQALAFGERALTWLADPVYRVQRYTLCDFRGNLEEVEASIRDLAVESAARPVFRGLPAHLQGRLGRLQEARRMLDDLAGDRFSALPFDMEWPFGMSLLAETSALLRDTGSGEVLYGLLLPWRAANVVDDALEMNKRMGARPWLAFTQEDYGRMLLDRVDTGRGSELVATAFATYRELGIDSYAARAQELVEAYT